MKLIGGADGVDHRMPQSGQARLHVHSGLLRMGVVEVLSDATGEKDAIC
ncbi:hypothetical protein [Thalassospira sp.]